MSETAEIKYKMQKNEKRFSQAGERAINNIFRIFNESFFDRELSAPDFLLSRARGRYCGGFIESAGVLKLAVNTDTKSVFTNPVYGKEKFEECYRSGLPETLVHEMCHMWQVPHRLYRNFTVLEYHALYEAGNYEEIHRREEERRKYFTMHDEQFKEKMQSIGISEEYSGRALEITNNTKVIDGSPYQKLMENPSPDISESLDILISEMFSYVKVKPIEEFTKGE